MTVTGSPAPALAPSRAPSTVARATATARSGSSSSAAPAPVLRTFGTGQPMLMSIASAPRSATTAAASRITAGSSPNSWIDTGPPGPAALALAGSIRSISLQVFSLPWWIACEETISETAMPAP